MKWAKHKSGFTIVELLIVIVVIAILAAVTIVAYNGISQNARKSALKSELSQVAKALETAKIKAGTGLYPNSLADVRVDSDKLTYHYNDRSNTYCVDGQDDAIRFSVRGSRPEPAEFPCTEQGIELWLPFNGNTLDESDNDYTLTVGGAPTPTTGANGAPNGAYAFDGTDDYLFINSDSIPAQLERFTVSGWVRGTGGSTGTDYYTLVHRGNVNSIGGSVIWVGATTGQNISVSANGQFGNGATGIIADNSTWHHVVLVYAGGYQTGYVDGVQRAEHNIGAVTNTATGNRLSIGASHGSGYRDINGAIDDVRIYNRALTADEVSALFADGAR